MNRSRHLTFSNVASATALAVALTGGGVAVAAGLANNSVGSAQIKKGAVKSSDIDNNGVKGKDIKESSLGKVPSAGTVDKLTFGARVTAAPGQTVPVATRGPLTITLACNDLGGGNQEFRLELTTSQNGAAFDANVSGSDVDTLNVGDVANIANGSSTAATFEHVGFSALTPAGEQWQGYGMAASRFGGAAGCVTEIVFIG